MAFETRELMVRVLAEYETDVRNCGAITCLLGTLSFQGAANCCGLITNVPCIGITHTDMSPCKAPSGTGEAPDVTCFTQMHELLGAMALADIRQNIIDHHDAASELARSAIARVTGE